MITYTWLCLLQAAPLKGNEWYIFVHGDKGVGHSLELSPVSVLSALEQGRGINYNHETVQKPRTDILLALRKSQRGHRTYTDVSNSYTHDRESNFPLSS